MRLRTHLITSALAGLALHPHAPRRALLLALAGVLVDLDHFVLYALRSGDWSLAGALDYDRRRSRAPRPGEARPRYGSLRSIIHHAQLTLPLLWGLSRYWPALTPVAQGLTLHLALDTDLYLRLDWRVWRRARGRCEGCRVGGLPLAVYYVERPAHGGARWALHNRAAWCQQCQRAARRRRKLSQLTER